VRAEYELVFLTGQIRTICAKKVPSGAQLSSILKLRLTASSSLVGTQVDWSPNGHAPEMNPLKPVSLLHFPPLPATRLAKPFRKTATKINTARYRATREATRNWRNPTLLHTLSKSPSARQRGSEMPNSYEGHKLSNFRTANGVRYEMAQRVNSGAPSSHYANGAQPAGRGVDNDPRDQLQSQREGVTHDLARMANSLSDKVPATFEGLSSCARRN